MRSFEHQAGTERIVFGSGTVAQIAAELDRLGCRQALVLATPEQGDLAARVSGILGAAAAGTLAASW